MASAKFVRAMAEGKVRLQKGPKVSGEVWLTFRPLLDRVTGKKVQPAPLSISTWKVVEPLNRSDVTLDNLKSSNLEDLVRRQAVVLV